MRLDLYRVASGEKAEGSEGGGDMTALQMGICSVHRINAPICTPIVPAEIQQQTIPAQSSSRISYANPVTTFYMSLWKGNVEILVNKSTLI